MRSGVFIRIAVPFVAFSAALVGSCRGQAIDIGRYEFETYCAVCHGKDGKGAGPFSMLVTKKVPDLTTLSKSEGGVFPFARVYGTISGQEDILAHGGREMPIWGDHYSEKATRDLGPYYQPADASSYVRGKILALIGYVSTLQIK